MTIVAGTDFSNNAREAAQVAAALAGRLGTTLKLVHVLDEPGAEAKLAGDQAFVFDARRTALAAHAEELRAAHGVEVEPLLRAGDAERTLAAVAQECAATLVVVSSLGNAKPLHWLVGSVAERIAQLSPVPTLVVRQGARLLEWARGARSLRVLVGVEPGPASRQALAFVAALRRATRCDVSVVQVVWPLGEHLRLGVPLPIPAEHLRPEVHEPLLRDLKEWTGTIPGEGSVSVRISPAYSRVDAHLAALAVDENADLLVVGSHRRSTVARLWQGSVSRGVLHQATCNVATVPGGDASMDLRDAPTFRRVLVPTDLSPLSNRALVAACGLLSPGGTLHLLHVVGSGDDEVAARAQLMALVPAGLAARGLHAEVEVVADKEAALAITQAAARLGVDAVCMATHGRSGLSRVALGSQAAEVVRRASRPVLLVPPERDSSERSF